MLKLGKLTDYATVLLAAIAAEPARTHAAIELSAHTQIAAPTVAKLLKKLQKGGLLESVRGAHGGYRLSRPPAEVTVADVIRTLDGPIALTDCAVHEAGCHLSPGCAARAPFRLLNAAILQALESVTLAGMAGSWSTAQRAAAAQETPIQFTPARTARKALAEGSA